MKHNLSKSMIHRLFWFSGLALLLVLTTSCGSDDEAEKDANALRTGGPPGGRARLGNLQTDGFQVTPFDINEDGKPDQWTYKSDAKVIRQERDMNGDGRVDMWQYPAEDGTTAEEEMDLDLDGRIDLVVHYTDGVLSKKEMSVDFTGKFSIVKFYDKAGSLLRVERDEDGNGKPDIFEYFENNSRVRVGWDEDGDGNPDKFDTL